VTDTLKKTKVLCGIHLPLTRLIHTRLRHVRIGTDSNNDRVHDSP
jgi:hypothetical protein